jgi:DNA modification methylase
LTGGAKNSLERKVEHLPIEALSPYPRNARTHSKAQIRDIARSIERFGFTNPILIDEAGQIIAGHGRVAAARLLGMKRVPTLQIDHLSEVEKRAYILADNRLAEKAGWDRATLAIELQGLVDADFDVELTGFATAEIDLVLDEASEQVDGAVQPEDIIPDMPRGAAVTESGDMWVLGSHRLICADARDATSYNRLLQGRKAEFVFADPPYNVKIERNARGLGRFRHRDFVMASGEMTPAEYTGFLQACFVEAAAHSIDGSIHDVCIDWRHIDEMLAAGRKVYGELKNICVWCKTNAGMGSFYRSQHELVFIWKVGSAPHINNFELGQFGRSRSNVWEYAGVNTFKSGRLDELAMHPTVKPVALVVDAIRDCSRRGGLIMDPFAGSGTTVLAAEKTGRQARAIEIDPHYCDTAIRRWQAYTGRQALDDRTGMSLEDRESAVEQRETKRSRGDEAPKIAIRRQKNEGSARYDSKPQCKQKRTQCRRCV